MNDNKPAATAALAQTQEPAVSGASPSVLHQPGVAGVDFSVSARATLADARRPYERKQGDPIYRPLKIFTLDPSIPRLDGAIEVLKVPYEKLAPGPVGAIFEVDNDDGFQRNQRVNLDDPLIVMNDGIDPTPSDPRFHQQMVYAVASSVYAAFRTALGRHVTWSFPSRTPGSHARLILRPHALRDTANAYYDPHAGEVCFGFFRSGASVKGRNLPRSWVFTSLSHDIVVHEVTHALLDGLRAQFAVPTNADVLAFHEALADLVAVLQHFSYRHMLEVAIAKSRGSLQLAPLLTELAWQFSQTQEGNHQGNAMRSAVDDMRHGRRTHYGEHSAPHALGAVLVAAIFEAFTTVYARKTRRFIQLATGGSGLLPEGELSPHLVEILAEEASALASHFLSVCIRAVDYCPPVDLTFGEYLRALVTADHALVPDDKWLYREALIDAFRMRGIYPPQVPNLSEDALLWRSPEDELPACAALSFAVLEFRGDPSEPSGPEELRRQAVELGKFVTGGNRARLFGLMRPEEARRRGIEVGLPTVESIRTTRRVGPSGQIVFDLVAEITQTRVVRTEEGGQAPFYGGATVIFDPEGRIRYVIAKGVNSKDREDCQRRFMSSDHGRQLWGRSDDGRLVPTPNAFRLIHSGREFV
jgi:hypothetical protein